MYYRNVEIPIHVHFHRLYLLLTQTQRNKNTLTVCNLLSHFKYLFVVNIVCGILLIQLFFSAILLRSQHSQLTHKACTPGLKDFRQFLENFCLSSYFIITLNLTLLSLHSLYCFDLSFID